MEAGQGFMKSRRVEIMYQRMETAQRETHFFSLACVSDGFKRVSILDKTHGAPEPAVCVHHGILTVAGQEYPGPLRFACCCFVAGLAPTNVIHQGTQVIHDLLRLWEHMPVDALQNGPMARVDGYHKGVVDQSMSVGADIDYPPTQVECGGDIPFKGHGVGAISVTGISFAVRSHAQ
jgi:hypothetical protein